MIRDKILLIGIGNAGEALVYDILDINDNINAIIVNEEMKRKIGIRSNNSSLMKEKLKQPLISIVEQIAKSEAKIVYLVGSLDGSFSSNVIKMVSGAISKIKQRFDTVVNIIGISPTLDVPILSLQNALETYDVIKEGLYDGITNTLFIDNNTIINKEQLTFDEVNKNFAKLFNSLLDIQTTEGIDEAELLHILSSKGNMMIYNLDDEFENLNDAINKAEENSVLAKWVFNGNKQLECEYILGSFKNKNYNIKDILDKNLICKIDCFTGINNNDNILVLTGLDLPITIIELLKYDLEDAIKERQKKQEELKAE